MRNPLKLTSSSRSQARCPKNQPRAVALLALCVSLTGPLSPATANPASTASPAPAASDGGYRTAIDLISNRVHAVAHRQGRLMVEAGSPDFLKYIDGN